MTRPNGFPIVLSAPLTETIDNPGFFIQMGLASMPSWMEWAIDRNYPHWREVPVAPDGSAVVAPCGLRTLEDVLARTFGAENVAVCYPDRLDQFIGPDTKVVALSTHNPLGTTFAAGVYASMFGSSKNPLNAVYARRLFQKVKDNPNRARYKVIVGGSGAWQIVETNAFEELGVDSIVDGRAEAAETLDLFRRVIVASSADAADAGVPRRRPYRHRRAHEPRCPGSHRAAVVASSTHHAG